MGFRVYAYLLILIFAGNASFVQAQRVLYSPYIDDRFEFAGKAGNFYWVWKKEMVISGKGGGAITDSIEERSFEIYDSRMKLSFLTPSIYLSPSIEKEYIISNDYFDLLQIQSDHHKTNLLLSRYTADGKLLVNAGLVYSLPFSEAANSFLLSRSEDRSKILILGFENVPGAAMRVHAMLFDNSWRRLSYKIYEHLFFSQPLIQDDFTNYPIEFFDNNALKVANDGQWLMMLPSRQNANYSLIQFTGRDSSYFYKEIKSPIYSILEDVALSIDNEKHEVYASVLSSFRYPTLKNVEVVHYSMLNHQIDFDTTFRFNTLIGYRVKDENIIRESFVSVPRSGFMLLKEYGKTYIDMNDLDDYNNSKVLKFFFASNSISSYIKPSSLNRDGYTRYAKLGGTRKVYQRGDLTMFYFPARKGDSCWSGIVNKEQISEFNMPILSYMVVPIEQKLFFLYNSFFKAETRYGNSTVLDYQGNLIEDEGPVYWQLGNLLDFQHAKRISDTEMAMPYEHNRRFGFAVIRFLNK
jgi:hypothetical protein